MSAEREKDFIRMVNTMLVSFDKIAVSTGMGSSRAEAIRAIDTQEILWREFKQKHLWDKE